MAKLADRAVDRAIAKLRAFADAYPRGQLVVELVPRPNLASAAAELDEGALFARMHRAKAGRWLRGARRAPRGTSSFAYFLARYGTLTWVVSPELDARGFLCGNVSGGGWGVLEIGPSFNKSAGIAELARMKELAGHGFDRAIAFHGGWGHRGYIMDGRITSPDGEHPIYSFDIDQPAAGLPHESRLRRGRKVEPFGIWLGREVNGLIRDLRPRLAAFAATQAVVAAERAADERAIPGGTPITIDQLAKRAKVPYLAELYRDKATSEVWATYEYEAKVIVYDGKAIIPNRRVPAGLATLRKLAAADRDEARGVKAAGFRSTRVRRDGNLFVSIEVLGCVLVVYRGWNNGLADEERRIFADAASAVAASEALDARYRRTFAPVTTKVGGKPIIRTLWCLEGGELGYVNIRGRTGAALEAALAARRDGTHHLQILAW